MSEPSLSPYVQSRPLAMRRVEIGAITLHHERHIGFAASLHAHAGVQILLPVAGRMRLAAEGQDHALGPEGAALVFAGVRHAVMPLEGELEFLAIDAPADWLEGALASLRASPVPRPPVLFAKDAGFWAVGRLLAGELAAQRPGGAEILAAGLGQLGIFFARALVPGDAAAPASAQDPLVMQAVDRILRDFPEELTVDALARAAALSPRHFERRFKELVGLTPKKFLIDVRLGAAREMLANTDTPVAEVGYAVGFGTPSHFTETFLRVLGQTPSAFRRAARGGGPDAGASPPA